MPGISRVPSTDPWVSQVPVAVSIWLAMTLSSGKPSVPDGLAPARQPAEPEQRDDQARDAPGGDDEQVRASEAEAGRMRVVGREQRVREVPDREDVANVRQPARQDRDGD